MHERCFLSSGVRKAKSVLICVMFISSSCWRKKASLPLKFILLCLVLVQATEVAALSFEDASFPSQSFLHFFPWKPMELREHRASANSISARLWHPGNKNTVITWVEQWHQQWQVSSHLSLMENTSFPLVSPWSVAVWNTGTFTSSASMQYFIRPDEWVGFPQRLLDFHLCYCLLEVTPSTWLQRDESCNFTLPWGA